MMVSGVKFSRNIMVLVLVLSLFAGAGVDWSTGTGNDDNFVIVNRSERSSGQRPRPVEVSVAQTALQEEPEILVTADGCFEFYIDAPDRRKYTALSIPGCGVTAEDIGYPAMPFKGFFLEIPYGVDVSVELVDESVSSLGEVFVL